MKRFVQLWPLWVGLVVPAQFLPQFLKLAHGAEFLPYYSDQEWHRIMTASYKPNGPRWQAEEADVWLLNHMVVHRKWVTNGQGRYFQCHESKICKDLAEALNEADERITRPKSYEEIGEEAANETNRELCPQELKMCQDNLRGFMKIKP